MKNILIVCAVTTTVLLLSGCDGTNESAITSQGKFNGTFADNEYTVPVNCYSVNSGNFTFNTSGAAADAQVAGFQQGAKLTFDLTIDGTLYNTPNLQNWTMTATGGNGNGALYTQSGSTGGQVEFEVECNQGILHSQNSRNTSV